MSDEAPVRLLRRAQVADASRWEAPALGRAAAPDGAALAGAARAHLPTARELEALQKAAFDEAFARGLDEGRAEGAAVARREILAQQQSEAQRLTTLLDAMAAPLEGLDERLESELLALVLAMARQVIRRELRTSPDEIVGAVREALAQLPVASRDVRVELHPDDARLVRERLHDDEAGDRRWRIVEDPLLQRGGCRVKTDESLIDATLDARLGALASQLFGDQRSDEGAGDDDAGAPARRRRGGRPRGG